MKDFPIELVLVFEALSKKDCRETLLRLSSGSMNVTELHDTQVNALISAGMVWRFTKDFKEYWYEISHFGNAVLKAMSSILNPKLEEEAKEVPK